VPKRLRYLKRQAADSDLARLAGCGERDRSPPRRLDRAGVQAQRTCAAGFESFTRISQQLTRSEAGADENKKVVISAAGRTASARASSSTTAAVTPRAARRRLRDGDGRQPETVSTDPTRSIGCSSSR
jgi:hypothetical protein